MPETYKPRITFLDIETSPNKGDFWRPGPKVNLSTSNIDIERVVLSASWLHEDHAEKGLEPQYTDALKFVKAPKDSNYKWIPDDKQIIKDIVKGLRTTDILVHHNGDKFDLPWINGRALYHGLVGVGPLRTVDTLKVARKVGNLNSYRLDYLAKYLKVDTGGKIHTDYDLWKNVMNRDEQAYTDMLDYNIHDVKILRAVYRKLEPYNTTLIKPNEIEDENSPCPFCGSTHKQKRGHRLNVKSHRRSYSCRGCGKWLIGPLVKGWPKGKKKKS